MRCRFVVVMVAVMAGSSMAAEAQSPAMQPPSDTGTASAAVVTGMVYDSVARAPLADALVQMRAESGSQRVFSASTDSAGAYRIANLPRGRYLATFFHPELESLGILPIMWRVEVTDSVTRMNLAVPSAATIWAATCHGTSTDSTGLVVGHVHDADSGIPLGGSVVSATWNEIVIDQHGLHVARRQLAATVNDMGTYALCGVPTDADVLMRAQHETTSSGVVEIAVTFHGLTKRDFGIGSSDSTTTVAAVGVDSGAARSGDGTLVRRGTARLTGTFHSPGGVALSDVELAIPGSDVRGRTDARGQFALADLPPGTYTLEARHLGFAPKRTIVDLSSHHTTTIDVTLDKQVAVLNTVHVYGKRTTRWPDLDGFLQRRRRGFGHFLTRQDIEKQHPFFLTDALRMVPGVQVSTAGVGHTILMRGGSGLGKCGPVIYLDGMRVYGDVDDLIDPQDVDGIEVYTGPGQAPVQFEGQGCGSLVIWSRFHLGP